MSALKKRPTESKSETKNRQIKSNTKESSEFGKKITFAEILQKAVTPNGGWDKDTFEEFPNVVFWMRQIIGLLFGVAFGIYPMTGIMGLVYFMVANLMLPFFYYAKFAAVNVDDFGPLDLASAGFQSSHPYIERYFSHCGHVCKPRVAYFSVFT
eukprot:gene1949-3776_t